MTRNGPAYPHPWPAHQTTGSGSSSPRTPRTLFRTPLALGSSRGGETLDQVRARRGTIALSHQVIDFALHGPNASPTNRNDSETLFNLIETVFADGYATPRPSHDGSTSPDTPPLPPAILNEDRGPRPSPEFAEWLMGLPVGWITEQMGELTANQQNTALGNGVLPIQALPAPRSLGLRMEPR